MVYKLVSEQDDQVLELPSDRTIVLGRSITCDIIIDNPAVSRRHAELTLVDDGIMAKDLGSSNGTFVNGARIGMAMVTDGDLISFGTVAFRVMQAEAASEPIAKVPEFESSSEKLAEEPEPEKSEAEILPLVPPEIETPEATPSSAKIREVETPSGQAILLANLQRYFPADLAAQIASGDESINITAGSYSAAILFCSIKDINSLAETVGPVEFNNLLRKLISEIREILFKHGGTLNKSTAGALTAVWGAPVTKPDDVHRAMNAGIEIMGTLERLNGSWSEQGWPVVSIGIGMEFGKVFAGNLGSKDQIEYIVIGKAIDSAAAFCTQSAPGEMLLSQSFYEAVGRPAEVDIVKPVYRMRR